MSKSFFSYFQNLVSNRRNLVSIASNTSWLVIDKAIRMIIGLVVGVWIARYLGPENFGVWSYALAFTLIFSAFANLGMDGVVINRIIRNPGEAKYELGSALFLRLVNGIFTCLLAIIAITLLKGDSKMLVLVVSILAISFMVQSLEVIDLYFQSKLQSKFTVLSKLGALVISSVFRIAAITSALSLFYFAIIQIVELLLGVVFLAITNQYKGIDIKQWRVRFSTIKEIIRSSVGLMIDSILVVIMMQADKILIASYHDDYEVGIYSTGTTLSQLGYFIPLYIGTSVIPFLIESFSKDREKYIRDLKKVLRLMTYSAIFISLGTIIFGKFVISFLYGAAYSSSYLILIIHVWCSVFVFHVSIRNRILVLESIPVFVGIFSMGAAALNVMLNLLLVPQFGGKGAAIASLLTWAVGVLLLPLFFKDTRKYVSMFFESFMLKSLNLKYDNSKG